MLLLPLQLNNLQYDLCVILEEENLVRLKQYDPGEVKFPIPGFEAQRRATMTKARSVR